jgi:hypothetical protein
MSNDNNFLLSVLGVVGIGALVMGLQQQDECEQAVKEDYNSGMTSFPFGKYRERLFVGKDGCVRAANFATQMPGAQKLDQQIRDILASDMTDAQKLDRVRRLQEEGKKQATQRVAQMAVNSGLAAPGSRTAQLAVSAPAVQGPKETYIPDQSLGLGANAVTEPYYFSNGEYDQTVPQRSPSLNLGRDIRYNPPSIDRMGITEAYQNTPQNAFGGCVAGKQQALPPTSTIEHYNLITENYDCGAGAKKLPPFQAGIRGYPGADAIANKTDFVKQVATGNAEFADKNALVIAPLTCQENCDDTTDGLIPLGPDGPDNVVMVERLMYVPQRPGHRQKSSGSVDYIRGDLPVCVDPCQAGWFQASQKPAFLQQSALAIGQSGAEDFIRSSGGNVVDPNAGQQITAQDLRVKAQVGTSSVVANSFP